MDLQLSAVSNIKEQLINRGFTELTTISCGENLLVRSQLEYRDKIKLVECTVNKQGFVKVTMSANDNIILSENNVPYDSISGILNNIPTLLFEEKQ